MPSSKTVLSSKSAPSSPPTTAATAPTAAPTAAPASLPPPPLSARLTAPVALTPGAVVGSGLAGAAPAGEAGAAPAEPPVAPLAEAGWGEGDLDVPVALLLQGLSTPRLRHQCRGGGGLANRLAHSRQGLGSFCVQHGLWMLGCKSQPAVQRCQQAGRQAGPHTSWRTVSSLNPIIPGCVSLNALSTASLSQSMPRPARASWLRQRLEPWAAGCR